MTYNNSILPTGALMRAISAAFISTMLMAAPCHAQQTGKYTADHPLIVVCDIEFQPFEYRSDNGEPAGFNVELADMLLDELQVPHVFINRERRIANTTFYANEADLMIAPAGEHIPGVAYGTFPVATYRAGIAYKSGTTPIADLRQLGRHESVIVKDGDYAAQMVEQSALLAPDQIQRRTVKQGIYGVASGRYPYMICGEQTLRAIKDKYQIESVDIDFFDIPSADIVFMSRDRQLVDRLDKLCAAMAEDGRLDKLNDKWFRDHTDKGFHIDKGLAVALLCLLALVVASLIIRQIVRRQIGKTMQNSVDLNNIIQKAIEMGKSNVVATDITKMELSNLYGNHLPTPVMSQRDNFERIHPDDQPAMVALYDNFKRHATDTQSVRFRWNKGTVDNPLWRTMVGQSIAEYDKHGRLTHLITTLSDITDEEDKGRRERQMSEIYRHLFNMPLVGLALYDSEGTLIEANEALWGMVGGETSDLDETCFFDLPWVRGNVDRHHVEQYFVCTCSDITGNGQPDFIDFRMRPVRDNGGELHYMMVTARNMRTHHDMLATSRVHDREVRRMALEMQKYETELKYLLEQSHITVWRSNFKKRTITLFKDLRTYERRLTFDQYVDMVEPEFRSLAMKFIDTSDEAGKPLKGVLKMKDVVYGDDEPRYLSINSIPDRDDEGDIRGRFGLARDINDVMVAQEKMRREKERAEDSSRLKSVFLANMSHEIRTPLNAIVGFCDVLRQVDDPSQRKEFIDIINSNSELLLQLVDDILIISEADSKGLSISPRNIDFSAEFALMAASLSARVSNPNVQFIVDNPYSRLHAEVDKYRIQQVMTNFVTNAVKYTQQGHIKIGYSLVDNGIRLYCEDTGVGIPADKTDKVFGRFVKLNDYVQGAGLGLSICKTIAEQCGGKIGVDSKVGEGSTFWMWLPCPTSEPDK